MRRHPKTKEEKLAETITDSVSDLRFDLEFAGRYLAWSLPSLAYRRIKLVFEAMEEERENNGRNHIRKQD